MQVRPGAVSRAADVAEQLAGLHARAPPRGEAGQMRVAGREAAGVGDADDVPVAALLTGEADRAAGGRLDRAAGRRGDVDALVHAAPARAERRADGPAHRRTKPGRAAAHRHVAGRHTPRRARRPLTLDCRLLGRAVDRRLQRAGAAHARGVERARRPRGRLVVRAGRRLSGAGVVPRRARRGGRTVRRRAALDRRLNGELLLRRDGSADERRRSPGGDLPLDPARHGVARAGARASSLLARGARGRRAESRRRARRGRRSARRTRRCERRLTRHRAGCAGGRGGRVGGRAGERGRAARGARPHPGRGPVDNRRDRRRARGARRRAGHARRPDQRRPRLGPHDAVDRNSRRLLQAAHSGFGRGAEQTVGRDAERGLHPRHDLPARAEHQRQRARAQLDQPTGGLGVRAAAAAADNRRQRHKRPRQQRHRHRRRRLLAARQLTPRARSQLTPTPRALERALPQLGRSQVSGGSAHPAPSLGLRG